MSLPQLFAMTRKVEKLRAEFDAASGDYEVSAVTNHGEIDEALQWTQDELAEAISQHESYKPLVERFVVEAEALVEEAEEVEAEAQDLVDEAEHVKSEAETVRSEAQEEFDVLNENIDKLRRIQPVPPESLSARRPRARRQEAAPAEPASEPRTVDEIDAAVAAIDADILEAERLILELETRRADLIARRGELEAEALAGAALESVTA